MGIFTAIGDFFSKEAGQQRRRALEDFSKKYLEDPLDYYLGPTGIPDNIRSINELLNPIIPLEDASVKFQEGDVVGGLTDTALAALPVGGAVALKPILKKAPDAASKIADATSEAIQDTLAGFSMGASGAARGALEFADRIEVDPNALGMSGGNVRLKPKRQVDFSEDLVERLGEERAQAIADNIALVGDKTKRVGQDAGAGQLVSSYADLPVINPQDLVGSTVSSTQADLTRAGKVFDEFDGVKLDKSVPMLGGPFFPLQEQYFKEGVGWVSQGPKQARELIAPEKGGTAADFVFVSAMGDASHASNASLVQTMIETTKAFAREGKIGDNALSSMNDAIRNIGLNTKQDQLKPLANFTSFNDENIDSFIRGLSFEARKAIAKKLADKNIQAMGAPNIRRLLDQTIQPELAGQNLGDVTLVLKPRTGEGGLSGLIDLKEAGVMPHPSYQYGAGLDVVGRFENPVSRQSAFPDFYQGRGTLTDIEALSRGDRARNAPLDFQVQDQAASKDRRSFDLSNPRQLITPETADIMERSIGYAATLNPTTARLISIGKREGWGITGVPVNQGGVSPAKIQDAIDRNAGGVSLDKIDPQAIKKGDVKYFQLSGKTNDGRAIPTDVFFGIKKNPDYSWVDDFNGNPIKTGENDLALTGVVANELATGGVSIPIIMGKALEEGVTILDAFAVPSKRYPDGFLPEIYEDYGFETVGKVPFDKDIFLAENSEKQYNELLSYWRSTGWDESRGFPDVVVMKWRGNDSDRAGAARNILSANSKSFGRAEIGSPFREAKGLPRQGVQPTVEGGGLPRQDIGSGDTGSVRQNNVTQLTNRSRGSIGALENLTPMQRANLGIP